MEDVIEIANQCHDVYVLGSLAVLLVGYHALNLLCDKQSGATHTHQCQACRDMLQALCRSDTRVYITFWTWRMETSLGHYSSLRSERHLMCVRVSLRHFLSYRMHVIMSLTEGLDDWFDLRPLVAKTLLGLMNVTNSWNEPMTEIHEWNQVFQL